MGLKRRPSPRVRVELELSLRGGLTVVLEEAVAVRIERRVGLGERVTVRDIGLTIDWADVARRGRGGALIVGCEVMGRLS